MVHFTFKHNNMTCESMRQTFEPMNNPSKSLFPNTALVKYITSRVIPIDLIWFSNGPNLANDQQRRIKITVLPDLFKAKGVRHLNMLRSANTEKIRLLILWVGVNSLILIWSILSFYNMQSSNSHGSPFFYNKFEDKIPKWCHHFLPIFPLLSGLMQGILRFIIFIYFYLQFGFATAWCYDFSDCKVVHMPK